MNEYLVILAVLLLGLVAVVLANRRHAGVPHRSPERMPTLPVRKITASSAGLRSALVAGLQPDQSLTGRTGSAPVAKSVSLPGFGGTSRAAPTPGAAPRGDFPSPRDLLHRADPPLRAGAAKTTAPQPAAHGLFRAAPPQLTPQPEDRPAEAAPSKREQMRNKLFSSPMVEPERPAAPSPADASVGGLFEAASAMAVVEAAPAPVPEAKPAAVEAAPAAAAIAPAPAAAPIAAAPEAAASIAAAPETAAPIAAAPETAAPTVAAADDGQDAGQIREFSAGPDETAVVEDFDPVHDVLTLPAYPMLAEYVKAGYLLTFDDGQSLLLAGLVAGQQPPPVWEVVPPETAEDRTAS